MGNNLSCLVLWGFLFYSIIPQKGLFSIVFWLYDVLFPAFFFALLRRFFQHLLNFSTLYITIL